MLKLLWTMVYRLAFHLVKISNKPVNIFQHINFGPYFVDDIRVIAHHIGHNVFEILIVQALHIGGIIAIIINGFLIITAAAANWNGDAAVNPTSGIAAGAYSCFKARFKAKAAAAPAGFYAAGGVQFQILIN